MRVVGWRLYYGDGSTVSSADGAWAAAPAVDVQALVAFLDDNPVAERWLFHGYDVYGQTETGLLYGAHVVFGADAPLPGAKYGRRLAPDAFAAIRARAEADRERP